MSKFRVQTENEYPVKMLKEATDMAQEKEVQNMLLQEDFVRMDLASYRHQARDEGFNDGLAAGEVQGTIKTYYRIGKRPSEIIGLIESDLHLDHDAAEKYVEETLGSQTS